MRVSNFKKLFEVFLETVSTKPRFHPIWIGQKIIAHSLEWHIRRHGGVPETPQVLFDSIQQKRRDPHLVCYWFRFIALHSVYYPLIKIYCFLNSLKMTSRSLVLRLDTVDPYVPQVTLGPVIVSHSQNEGNGL